MTRVWFNRTFSDVRAVLDLIRRGDAAGEFHLVCTHPEASFPGFVPAHEHALEPAGLSGADYVDFCVDFCRKRHIDALWPGKEARLLAEQRERFAAIGVQLLSVAAPESLDRLHDKALFSLEARRFSIPTPETIPFRTAAEFTSAYERLRLTHERLCIKPVKGMNGDGFRVIREGGAGLEGLVRDGLYSIELDCLHQRLARTPPEATWLLMEYLAGDEYSLDAVGDGRRLIALTQRRKAAGGTYGQQIVARPDLTQAVSELTERFGLTGLFNVQFREGPDGPRLLEVNPRFAGGIGYTGATGLNLPYLALRGLIRGFTDQDYQDAPRLAPEMTVLEVAQYERHRVEA
ncbi:MAG: ATP-grasp domain-containing protein [Thermochromatium sp.]